MDMKNTERFSDRVKNYVRYRPHYPKAIIPYLQEQIGLISTWLVADIGSGTGISSELFLLYGNTVYGIEPNKKMRESAEKLYTDNKRFISLNATAEATLLPDESMDLIIAGQAFHWFDKEKAKKEIQRISKSESYLILMWNERKIETPFQQEFEDIFGDAVPDYKGSQQRNIDEKAISDFFSPQTFTLKTFHNSQFLDLEGFKGRVLSSSYAPLEHELSHKPLMQKLEQLFEKYKVDSKIEFEYTCKLYYGRIKE